MSNDTDDRFWSFVDRNGPIPEAAPALGACWLWTLPPSRRGYGQFSAYGRTWAAHRWSYERWMATIPVGLVVDHLCRVKMCVNPAHLEPVTARENILRGEGVAAKAARMTHCKYGHEFSPDNIRASARGVRRCKACKREASRRERERAKAAQNA